MKEYMLLSTVMDLTGRLLILRRYSFIFKYSSLETPAGLPSHKTRAETKANKRHLRTTPVEAMAGTKYISDWSISSLCIICWGKYWVLFIAAALEETWFPPHVSWMIARQRDKNLQGIKTSMYKQVSTALRE